MKGISDLLASERGAFCIALLIASTVLVIINKLDAQMWVDLMKYVGVTLIASKAVTTAVETYTTKKPQIPVAEVHNDSQV